MRLNIFGVKYTHKGFLYGFQIDLDFALNAKYILGEV